jgi:uncharacterized membrane protein
VIIYGTNLMLAGAAYGILVRFIIAAHGKGSDIAKAIGSDFKGNVSVAAYVAAIAVAFYNPWISGGVFIAVALIWFIPDRRIERMIKN